MAQEQVQKRSQSRDQETNVEETNPDVTNHKLAEKTEQVVSDIDDVLEDQLDEELLADIDGVLEQDAETFVDNYVQAGGE